MKTRELFSDMPNTYETQNLQCLDGPARYFTTTLSYHPVTHISCDAYSDSATCVSKYTPLVVNNFCRFHNLQNVIQCVLFNSLTPGRRTVMT